MGVGGLRDHKGIRIGHLLLLAGGLAWAQSALLCGFGEASRLAKHLAEPTPRPDSAAWKSTQGLTEGYFSPNSHSASAK